MFKFFKRSILNEFSERSACSVRVFDVGRCPIEDGRVSISTFTFERQVMRLLYYSSMDIDPEFDRYGTCTQKPYLKHGTEEVRRPTGAMRCDRIAREGSFFHIASW